MTVVLSRNEVRNAVDPEHADALYDAFVSFEADYQVDVAVLWGEGEAFCAGADLKSLAKRGIATRENAATHKSLEFPQDGSALPRGPMGPTRLQLSKPVIAAIEGPAVAGGMELALWADFRVMAEGSYMGAFNRRWGVPLTDGGTVRLPRLVGVGRALELIMTGRKVEADECLRIGLCNDVVTKGRARKEAERMAHEISRFPQLALRADKRSVALQYGLPVPEALRREWYNCSGTFKAEGAAGVAKFAAGLGRHGDFGDFDRLVGH
jgi:enoyl-CoA hydratase